MLFVINAAFIAVDWVVYREQFLAFLPVRLGTGLAVAFVAIATADKYPVKSSYVTVLAGAWMLFTVIEGTGGASSDYYVGLVLLIVGLGVLAPLSARQGSSMIGGLYVGFLILCLMDRTPNSWNQAALRIFFLGAASFCGSMSCFHLDRMRFADFLQRREIEQARDELKELDAAKSRVSPRTSTTSCARR